MTSHAVRRLLAAAAFTALAGFAHSPADAQYRIADDGHALDANNRIGSGGYNRGGDVPYRVSGNEVVTGNVTGGREFRGPVGYTDPTAFRGPTVGNSSDRFVRDSSGSPNSFAPTADLTRPMPYYGSSRAAPPPAGFTREGFNGGYIPAPVVANRQPGDSRLGVVNNATPNVTPMPGELYMPGPVDPSTQSPTYLTASPLYGVRRWSVDSESDRYFMSNFTNFAPRANGELDDSALDRYRQELNQSVIRPGASDQTDPNSPDATKDTRPQPLTDGRPLGAGPENPNKQPLPGQFSNPAYNPTADTGQGQRNRLLIPPKDQSTQYAELQRRLERSNQDKPLNDAEANRQYQELARAQKQPPDKAGENPLAERPKPATPDSGAPMAPTGRPATPSDQARPEHPAPIIIESLAKGIAAKGLATLLQDAESLMGEGKFAAALDKYDTAQQVAPNNPMILLGRANAEIGAGYYTRAESHIREAILTDPAILVGQYDLRKFIGDKRLQDVVTELKEIARTEQTQPTAVFLLSWIAYNTGSARQAAAYLDLAEKRVGRPDAIYRTLRDVWQLPAATTVPTEPASFK